MMLVSVLRWQSCPNSFIIIPFCCHTVYYCGLSWKANTGNRSFVACLGITFFPIIIALEVVLFHLGMSSASRSSFRSALVSAHNNPHQPGLFPDLWTAACISLLLSYSLTSPRGYLWEMIRNVFQKKEITKLREMLAWICMLLLLGLREYISNRFHIELKLL